MKKKNEKLWLEYIEANKDSYGAAVMSFAKRWADLMEAEIALGAEVKDIADRTSHQADTEGITGFMYGCAVKMLAECWEYGEQLRIWHNLDTQIGDEGEQANQRGTVLNPAILTIGKAENDNTTS